MRGAKEKRKYITCTYIERGVRGRSILYNNNVLVQLHADTGYTIRKRARPTKGLLAFADFRSARGGRRHHVCPQHQFRVRGVDGTVSTIIHYTKVTIVLLYLSLSISISITCTSVFLFDRFVSLYTYIIFFIFCAV